MMPLRRWFSRRRCRGAGSGRAVSLSEPEEEEAEPEERRRFDIEAIIEARVSGLRCGSVLGRFDSQRGRAVKRAFGPGVAPLPALAGWNRGS